MRIFIIFISTIILTATSVGYAQTIDESIERLQYIKQSQDFSLPEEQKAQKIVECNQNKQLIQSTEYSSDIAARKRIIIYDTTQKELKAMELRLTKQGADASEIDLLIGKIQQELDLFIEHARYSQQLAEDLIAIDCTQYPDLYAIGLQDYKKNRSEQLKTVTDLKQTIEEAPRTTFAPLVDRLQI